MDAKTLGRGYAWLDTGTMYSLYEVGECLLCDMLMRKEGFTKAWRQRWKCDAFICFHAQHTLRIPVTFSLTTRSDWVSNKG